MPGWELKKKLRGGLQAVISGDWRQGDYYFAFHLLTLLRTWTRTNSPAPDSVPTNMVNVVGTWYERQQAADGSPVLFRYDLNADGSYDMFK